MKAMQIDATLYARAYTIVQCKMLLYMQGHIQLYNEHVIMMYMSGLHIKLFCKRIQELFDMDYIEMHTHAVAYIYHNSLLSSYLCKSLINL